MQQSQIAGPYIVKVDLDILPVGAVVDQIQAVGPVVHDLDGEHLVCGGVDAVEVLPCEQVDAHDAEDEPENEAHQQHIHDGGDGPQQRVHHHLGRLKNTDKLSTVLSLRKEFSVELQRLFNYNHLIT